MNNVGNKTPQVFVYSVQIHRYVTDLSLSSRWRLSLEKCLVLLFPCGRNRALHRALGSSWCPGPCTGPWVPPGAVGPAPGPGVLLVQGALSDVGFDVKFCVFQVEEKKCENEEHLSIFVLIGSRMRTTTLILCCVW